MTVASRWKMGRNTPRIVLTKDSKLFGSCSAAESGVFGQKCLDFAHRARARDTALEARITQVDYTTEMFRIFFPQAEWSDEFIESHTR
jgi:hypothetical protein